MALLGEALCRASIVMLFSELLHHQALLVMHVLKIRAPRLRGVGINPSCSKDGLRCVPTSLCACHCLGVPCAGHRMNLSRLCCIESQDLSASRSAFDTGSCWMLVSGSCLGLGVFLTHIKRSPKWIMKALKVTKACKGSRLVYQQ